MAKDRPPVASPVESAASAEPKTAAPVGRRRGRRWIVIGVIFLAAASAGVFWGGPSALLALARRSLAHRDADTALEWLDWRNRFVAEDSVAAFLQARAYRRRGDMTSAHEALQRSLDLGATPSQVRVEQLLAMAQSGQLRESEPHLSSLLAIAGEDGPEICEAYVLGYMRAERFSMALRILEAWKADWPEQAYPYILEGRIRTLQSQRRTAEEQYREAIRLEPHNLEPVVELASVLERDNRGAEAIPLFERAVADPKLGRRARLGLANALRAEGEVDRARETLEQLVAERADDHNALRELGRLQLESRNNEAAARTLDQAAKLAPYDDEVRFLLGRALQALGRPDEARSHLEYAHRAREGFRRLRLLSDDLVANPGDPDVLAKMGEIYLQFADPREGVLRLNAALDRNPRHKLAHRLLAEYYEGRAAESPEYRELAERHRAALRDEKDKDTAETESR